MASGRDVNLLAVRASGSSLTRPAPTASYNGRNVEQSAPGPGMPCWQQHCTAESGSQLVMSMNYGEFLRIPCASHACGLCRSQYQTGCQGVLSRASCGNQARASVATAQNGVATALAAELCLDASADRFVAAFMMPPLASTAQMLQVRSHPAAGAIKVTIKPPLLALS
jgi:hypothetical protein